MATMRIDDIKAMAKRAHGDDAFREGLFEAMLGNEREEAVCAAWALTHLPKDDNLHIAAHRETLVQLATTTADISLRRITLTLLERLEWMVESTDDAPDYYVSLLDFCFEHLMMIEEPYGVRSLCMKLAYKLSLPYRELLDELRQSLLLIEPSDLGSGVRHTRNKILKQLQLNNNDTIQL